MVDQPHGRFARNPGAAEAIDVGDAQAMEGQMRLLILIKKGCHRRDG